MLYKWTPPLVFDMACYYFESGSIPDISLIFSRVSTLMGPLERYMTEVADLVSIVLQHEE